MAKHKYILAVFLLFGTSVMAQKGDVKVVKDARINALVAKQSEIIPPDINPQIDGFRIQLFFDSDRAAVDAARARFISKNTHVDTYIKYEAPNYYLKVGDFRTRLEADKIKSTVEAEFPTSFIIQEKVNLPRLRKAEQEN